MGLIVVVILVILAVCMSDPSGKDTGKTKSGKREKEPGKRRSDRRKEAVPATQLIWEELIEHELLDDDDD